METKINQIEVDRNKRPSYRQHKRQSFWQILLPILLSFLVMLAGLAFLIVIAKGGDPIGEALHLGGYFVDLAFIACDGIGVGGCPALGHYDLWIGPAVEGPADLYGNGPALFQTGC